MHRTETGGDRGWMVSKTFINGKVYFICQFGEEQDMQPLFPQEKESHGNIVLHGPDAIFGCSSTGTLYTGIIHRFMCKKINVAFTWSKNDQPLENGKCILEINQGHIFAM